MNEIIEAAGNGAGSPAPSSLSDKMEGVGSLLIMEWSEEVKALVAAVKELEAHTAELRALLVERDREIAKLKKERDGQAVAIKSAIKSLEEAQQRTREASP